MPYNQRVTAPMRASVVSLFLLLSLQGGASALADTPSPAPSASPSPAPLAPDRFVKIDPLFDRRAEEEPIREAYQQTRRLYKERPEDLEAAWRLAMSCYFVAERFTKTEDEKEALYDEGRTAGEAAVKGMKNCAPCHFWYAINTVLYADIVSPFKLIAKIGAVRDDAREVIRLDPKYAHGGAYRLLGQIELGLPGILGGSDEQARKYFEQAIQVAPDEPINYLFLVRALKKLDRDEEAVQAAKKGLALPALPPSRVEAHESVAALKDYLKEMEAKKTED